MNFYPFRVGSIGAYGPVAERIKTHCFFAKTVGTVPIFVGSVPFLLCRINAPFAKTVGTVPVFVESVPFWLCRVNAP